MNKSKTLALPVEELFAFFDRPRKRSRWLPGVKLTLGKATLAKSMRVKWHDGTPVEFRFAGKGNAKSQVTVQHRGLPTKAEAAARRRFWGERLDALAALAPASRRS